MNKPPSASDWYKETSDVQYHSKVFSGDPFVQQVLARNRANKLQPLLRDADSVLEFGVGTGLDLWKLRCRRRVGYDPSQFGKQACEQAGIQFVHDLEQLQGEKFSAVICHHVLEHVPSPLDSLRAMAELLQPGGRLILVVPYEYGRSFNRYRPDEINRHLYTWNPLTLGNLLDEAGFRPESVTTAPTGYEQRLAPLAKAGYPVYRLSLFLLRLMLPLKEVVAVSRLK